MHTGTIPAPSNDKPPSAVNYLSAFNSTAAPSTGLYLTSKTTDYPIINDVSNGSCYQTNLYSYNRNSFNNTTNCTTNSYDQAAINRRKNATRETTNTLKGWLYEHRKNPYPTKGEKIMLAIITKMTLTQVSTWFANARRRLKKENKMTWEPRNKCSNSGDEDDSSDAEYASNENESEMNTTTLKSENDDSRVNKRSNLKLDQDEEMNVDESVIQTKCDDSDSNTGSLKRNSPSAFDSNNYGKGDTTNYSTDPNYGNLTNHHDRFFPYQRASSEQIQFPYSASNRTQYPHITYSTSIQIPSVSNLTYAQSQINETSIYNQIHSHHYHNVHQPHNSTPSLPIAAQTIHVSQTNNTLTAGQQTNQDSLQQQTQSHHSVYHHAVPNLNAHPNYPLIQAAYPADYMLAHHTHQLHQTNGQQITQNSLYYPTPTTQVQSTNVNLRNSAPDLYTNQLPLVKQPVINSLNESSNKSDENNNLENNGNTANSSTLDTTTLENTRKIWSLAQTATDGHSIIPNNTVDLNQESSSAKTTVDTSSAVTYIDPTVREQSTQNGQQLVKGHSPPVHNISTYMNSQLANTNNNNSPSLDSSTMLTSANNQLTSYNNNTLHHQNYPIDCGQLAHNSNTFLGKVFFDYISTGTGPLEHDNRNWTRIGLL